MSQLTPMYGLGHMAWWPLAGDFKLVWLVNLLAWLAVFVGGAIWRFRRDSARV